MKLWSSLYALIWILLIEFLLVMIYPGNQILIYTHTVLGIIIIGITYYNFSGIRKTTIAGRVKRTAQACFNLSIVMVIFGVLLIIMSILGISNAWVIPLLNLSVYRIIVILHLIIALAMITQAAAVAIAHDMWEDKEFNEQTQPGSVPPAPKP